MTMLFIATIANNGSGGDNGGNIVGSENGLAMMLVVNVARLKNTLVENFLINLEITLFGLT